MKFFKNLIPLLLGVFMLCIFTSFKGGNLQRSDSIKIIHSPNAHYVGSFRYYNIDGLFVVVSVYVDPDNQSQVTFGSDLRTKYFTATGSYSSGYVTNFEGNDGYDDITYTGYLQ